MNHDANIVPPGQRIAALVVAAGRGRRMAAAGGAPKQYVQLGGQAILARTLNALFQHPQIDLILPVIHGEDRDTYEEALSTTSRSRALRPPVAGGETRQASVRHGLEALAANPPEYVLIHDGVRPFVDQQTLTRVIETLDSGNVGVVAGQPVVDTLKRTDTDGRVLGTPERDGVWTAQTPQGFRFSALLEAHRQALDSRHEFTDDAALMEWAGHEVVMVPGNRENFKITRPEDIEVARRHVELEAWRALADIRVGTGYDVHAFAAGDHVTLAGIDIPHGRGLAGHSDADVALHAITDAIYGALGDGDIGAHFPPSDPQWKGAASDIFLRAAIDAVARRGGQIAHLDLTLVCEAPKIGPHRDAMRRRIAEIAGVPIDRIAVKATTSERLGFTGRREGIAALATATIRLPL